MDEQYSKCAYEQFKAYLDKKKYNYHVDEESDVNNYYLFLRLVTEDIPIEYQIMFNKNINTVGLLSFMPFTFKKELTLDASVAVCYVNYQLNFGNFDYDAIKGKLCYRISDHFGQGKLSYDTIDFLFSYSTYVIDLYNDLFEKIASEKYDIKQFISAADEKKKQS